MTFDDRKLPAPPAGPVLHGAIDVQREDVQARLTREGESFVEELYVRRRVHRVVRIAVRLFGVDPFHIERRLAERVRALEDALRPFAEWRTGEEGGPGQHDALIPKAREVLNGG